MMQKFLKLLAFNFFFLFIFAANAAAQPYFGQCGTLNCPDGFGQQYADVENNLCRCAQIAGSGDTKTSEEVFGTINPPQGVAEYDAAAGAGQTGLIVFLSNIIRAGTVIAGIWVMVNFIMAGWTYITSAGDPKASGEASNKMTYSMIGIAIIVGAYTLAAVVGLVIFGDASYILSPKFTGVETTVLP